MSGAPRAARRSRPVGLVTLTVITALAFAVTGTPVTAHAADSAGNWWFDAYGMKAIHDEGWTGKGVKIAVIDGSINPDLSVFRNRNLTVDPRPLCEGAEAPTNSETAPSAVHGTTIVAEIIGTGEGAGAMRGIAPDAEVTFYSLGWTGGDQACSASQYSDLLAPVSLGIQRAIDDGAQIITTSLDDDLSPEVLANAVAKGVVVVYAGPNKRSGTDEGTTYSVRNGIVTVARVDENGKLDANDDGSARIVRATTVVAPGTRVPTVGKKGGSWDQSRSAEGTSYAAPLVAGTLALVAQRYPSATGNQLLQSLLRNTGAEDHEIANDSESGFGYGLVWPAHVLREDPTQYPDENPLLDKPGGVPTARQIDVARENHFIFPPRAVTATPTSEGAPAPETSSSPAFAPVLVGLAVTAASIVLAGAVVTFIVVTRMRRKTGGKP